MTTESQYHADDEAEKTKGPPQERRRRERERERRERERREDRGRMGSERGGVSMLVVVVSLVPMASLALLSPLGFNSTRSFPDSDSSAAAVVVDDRKNREIP